MSRIDPHWRLAHRESLTFFHSWWRAQRMNIYAAEESARKRKNLGNDKVSTHGSAQSFITPSR
jgi:hypothetical protein